MLDHSTEVMQIPSLFLFVIPSDYIAKCKYEREERKRKKVTDISNSFHERIIHRADRETVMQTARASRYYSFNNNAETNSRYDTKDSPP